MRLFRRISDLITARLSDLIDGRASVEQTLSLALRNIEAASRAALTRRANIWRLRLRVRALETALRATMAAVARMIADDRLAGRRSDNRRRVESRHEFGRQIRAMHVRLAEARRMVAGLQARMVRIQNQPHEF